MGGGVPGDGGGRGGIGGGGGGGGGGAGFGGDAGGGGKRVLSHPTLLKHASSRVARHPCVFGSKSIVRIPIQQRGWVCEGSSETACSHDVEAAHRAKHVNLSSR